MEETGPRKRDTASENVTTGGNVTTARGERTSSSTGGPVWIKPMSRGNLATRAVERTRNVATTVMADGTLRTTPVDPSMASLTVGQAWFRRVAERRSAPGEVAASRAIPEVTPISVPVAVPQVTADSRMDRSNVTLNMLAQEALAPAIETVQEAPAPTIETVQEAPATETTAVTLEPVRTVNEDSVPGIRGAMSVKSRQDLSTFISTAVLPKTNRVYNKEWTAFTEFVKTETGSDDPFLASHSDDEKASLVALFMMRRHEAGKRGKAASAFTAAVRQMYSRSMKSTTFLDSSIIATARTSCLMKPDELRAARDRGPVSTVKLPMCESLIAEMRLLLWGQGWTDSDLGRKSLYMGIAYGWEAAARVGEYTHCEPGSQNHCARKDDFTFVVETPGGTRNILGSGLSALQLADSAEGRRGILECRVKTVSSKGKIVVKPKLVGRRSPEESEFLDDLAAWLTYSGTSGEDEAFSYRKQDRSLVNLTGRAVREEIKRTCSSNGLPPDYFSSHSLRKGAVTHMRGKGASEDDRRDRGNYAAGSTVMNDVYDYATGLGPRASNSLEGGHRLEKKDLKRMIPARKSV